MNQTSALSRLALLQCLVIVTGVLTTCSVLKFYNVDPADAIRWNPVAVAVRDVGWLLLTVPALWTTACVVLERRTTNPWNRTWSILSGVLVVTLLVALLWWTTAKPFFFQKGSIQMW